MFSLKDEKELNILTTDELIYKIRNNELSNMEIENINKVLLNSTIKIGIFNFK